MARAELSDRERLQPSLLDRLTDRNPGDERTAPQNGILMCAVCATSYCGIWAGC